MPEEYRLSNCLVCASSCSMSSVCGDFCGELNRRLKEAIGTGPWPLERTRSSSKRKSCKRCEAATGGGGGPSLVRPAGSVLGQAENHGINGII